MTREGRIYLDTNVLIGLGETANTINTFLTQIIETQISAPAPLFVTSRLSFAELMVKPFRDRDGLMASVYGGWSVSNFWLFVVDVDEEILEHAALLRSQFGSLKLPDAIHLATALVRGCARFMTADKKIPDVPDLDHPFRGPLDVSPLTVIRPDEPTLSSVLQSLAA